MKKIMVIFAILVFALNATAQNRYENGWIDGSYKETVGIYYAPDKAGKYAVVLKIDTDSISFNGRTFYVDASKKEGKNYTFIAFDNEGNLYEASLNGESYQKYYKYLVTIKNEDKMMQGVVIKNITSGLAQEARWKQIWFDGLFRDEAKITAKK